LALMTACVLHLLICAVMQFDVDAMLETDTEEPRPDSSSDIDQSIADMADPVLAQVKKDSVATDRDERANRKRGVDEGTDANTGKQKKMKVNSRPDE
jgi:hypothetical protein